MRGFERRKRELRPRTQYVVPRWLLWAVIIAGALVAWFGCKPPVPVVLEGQERCWQPQITGGWWDVESYGIVSHTDGTYVLEHCTWRPYGGLRYGVMMLMLMDTVRVDSVEVLP